MRAGGFVMVLVVLAGCTDYRFADGLQCSETGECPPGYFCDDTGGDVCLRNLTGCGDGIRDGEELCDDGNRRSDDGCRADCLRIQACGDGVLDPGEICDDGNVMSGDGCRLDCAKLEACGDSVLDEGEECDDGNDVDTDDCPTTCRHAFCGDGFELPTEECDDGVANANDTACLPDCVTATCGDGFVRAGVEDCDDANAIETDACPSTCRAATCGDGFVQVGSELCDDGDAIDGNGCNANCRTDEVIQIAVGDEHTCALRADGSVRCWGSNSSGALGYGVGIVIGDNEHPALAGDVDVGGTVTQIVAGQRHTCALLDTGAVRCWGLGFFGALGYGNANNIGDNETPASAGDVVVGGIAVQLAAGLHHTCALLSTGAVRCWGEGTFGRLGYGNTTRIGDDESPASAGDVNLGGAAVQVAAGGTHTCALLATGAVRCWGAGSRGRLGYGNINNIGDDEAPASAGDVELGGTAVRIATGNEHSCAILESGTLRCWGFAADGRLGYASTNNVGDDETPASAGDVPVGGPIAQITAGAFHSCGLLTSGAVRCWGLGFEGRLGYANTNDIGDNETPASAGDVDVGGTVVQVAASSHTCALLTTGAVRCWGAGNSRLGYGNFITIGDNETPATAGDVAVGKGVVQVVGGQSHTCALLSTGTVRCWGFGGNGRLGHGNTTTIGDDEVAATGGDVDIGGVVLQLAAGEAHTCARLATGTVRCWGAGANGRLGYGNTNDIGDDETPASAGDVNIGGTVVQIATGHVHTCALLDTGAVRCWGVGSSGRLGYGNTLQIGDDETPASAGNVDVGNLVTQIAAGGQHTCAILQNGAVRCWGQGGLGRLGYGNTSFIGDDEAPASAGDVGVGGPVVQIATGLQHTCARLSTGTIRCWGSGTSGKLGYGNTSTIGDDETPSSIGDVSLGNTAVDIVTGFQHTCARLSTGTLRCWGIGGAGQLGLGTNDIGDDETPATAGDVPVGRTVLGGSTGSIHTCAVTAERRLRCWGAGGNGALGYGNTNVIGDDETPASAGDVPVF